MFRRHQHDLAFAPNRDRVAGELVLAQRGAYRLLRGKNRSRNRIVRACPGDLYFNFVRRCLFHSVVAEYPKTCALRYRYWCSYCTRLDQLGRQLFQRVIELVLHGADISGDSLHNPAYSISAPHWQSNVINRLIQAKT